MNAPNIPVLALPTPALPILYGVTTSRASRNVWFLEELGVAYARVLTPYKDKATHTPEFLALNPNAHIPVWVDENGVMWESLAINLYLARKHGGAMSPQNRLPQNRSPQNLSPQTLAEEGQALKWSFWAVTELERDCLTVLMHRLVMPEPNRKADLAAQAEGALRKPFGVLNAHLSKHAYVLGDRFTVADVNVAAIMAWARAAKGLLAEYPALAAWLASCLQREAYKKLQTYAKAEQTAWNDG